MQCGRRHQIVTIVKLCKAENNLVFGAGLRYNNHMAANRGLLKTPKILLIGHCMTEKVAKTVNYTPEMTTSMVADYVAGVTVEKIGG